MTSLLGFHNIFPNRFTRLFPCLLLMIVLMSRCSAQQDQPVNSETEKPALHRLIQAHQADLEAKEKAHASNRELGQLWSRLGVDYSLAGEFANAENAMNHAVSALSKDQADTDQYAEALDELGALYRVYGRIPEALKCRRQALTLREKLGDPLKIARSETHLAELALLSKHYKEALAASDAAYRKLAGIGNAIKVDFIMALLVRGDAECRLHRIAECLSDSQEAVAMSKSALPDDSIAEGAALTLLSEAQLRNGQALQAENSARQAVTVLKQELASGDPRVRFAITQDRDCLQALHRKDEAREAEAQLEAIDRRTAQPCVSCTVSVYGLRAPGH